MQLPTRKEARTTQTQEAPESNIMKLIRLLKELPDYYLLFFVIMMFLATYIYMPNDPLVRFLDLLIGGFLGIMKSQHSTGQKVEIENIETVEGDTIAPDVLAEDKSETRIL